MWWQSVSQYFDKVFYSVTVISMKLKFTHRNNGWLISFDLMFHSSSLYFFRSLKHSGELWQHYKEAYHMSDLH